jgi:proton-translocating NADH-quinone oxidoreductase chain L
MVINAIITLLFSICFVGVMNNLINSRGFLIYILTSLCYFCMFMVLELFSETNISTKIAALFLNQNFDVGLLYLSWIFYLDPLILLMITVVILISFFVHLYSIDYMNGDSSFIRFFILILLFTFFMIFLLSGENFFQLFIGWEGVGLCPYFLINFWNYRLAANKSAIKALIINRFGDVGLIIGIAILYKYSGNIEYNLVFLLTPYFVNLFIFLFNYFFYYILIVTIFLFFGVMGKSAQLGLHTWLPDAMEGPTPVSALIHAATMVTAGVFLLIKCSLLFDLDFFFLLYVIFIGSMTAIVASLIGISEFDIKKIIAFSTCSQLGFMVLACGVSYYMVALYHLFTHAFFKALLFLGSGAILHIFGDEQDFRNFGGTLLLMPLIATIIFIGSLALMGFPFLAGFYSKDLILEGFFGTFGYAYLFFQWLLCFATMLTAIYSMRLFFQVFCKKGKSFFNYYWLYHEASLLVLFILLLLVISSVSSGMVMQEIFSSVNVYLNFLIEIFTQIKADFEFEFYSFLGKIYPVICTSIGILICFIFQPIILFIRNRLKWKQQMPDENLLQQRFRFVNNKIISTDLVLKRSSVRIFILKRWLFDYIYNKILGKTNFFFSMKQFMVIDKGYLESFGPRGIVQLLMIYHMNSMIWLNTVNLIFFFNFFLLGCIWFFFFFILQLDFIFIFDIDALYLL